MRFVHKMWLNVVCFVIGHNIDPCDLYAEECFRCGLLFHYDEKPRDDIGFVLWWSNCKRSFRDLWTERTCEVCGERLSRGQGFICDRQKCSDLWMPF